MSKKKEIIENKEVKKKLGGRPSKLPLINQEHFEGMCRIQCTKDEICGILDIDEGTLTKWCKETYNLGFSDIYKKKSSPGKMSLRRQQFKSAENGNVTMQIWLGKQYLGQTDKIEQKQEDKLDVLIETLGSAIKNAR